jgi:uncharacterized protein (DUF2141 family)
MTSVTTASGARSRMAGLSCLLALVCWLPLAAAAQSETTTEPGPAAEPTRDLGSEQTQFDIVVHLTEAEPATGTVEISLFNSSENFLVNPYLQTSGPINEDGTYTARFGKVPPGDYAVVVVHDENGNGKLDTGFLGFGGETYAFSNDARPLFGRPGFDEAKFRVDNNTRIHITLD